MTDERRRPVVGDKIEATEDGKTWRPARICDVWATPGAPTFIYYDFLDDAEGDWNGCYLSQVVWRWPATAAGEPCSPLPEATP